MRGKPEAFAKAALKWMSHGHALMHFTQRGPKSCPHSEPLTLNLDRTLINLVMEFPKPLQIKRQYSERQAI